MLILENIISNIQLSHFCLVLITAQVVVLFHFWQKLNKQRQSVSGIESELKALLLCERGIVERLKQQQQQVRSMADRQDKLEITDTSSSNYKQAKALMQHGATTDELVDTCDLSRGELELISHLQNVRQALYMNKVA